MTSLHADEAFLDHYQLSHDPFAARVPGFKFFPAQRKPVLGQLHHLARYSQLLLVVTGPKGSGKTLLRQALVASTNKQTVQSVIVSAHGAADPGSLLRQVAQGLQLKQAEPAAILAQVGQLALTGQEVYLLVDDAEELSDAAVASLLTLAAGNSEGKPHVFLFSEPELTARLERLADGEECFHIIDLQPYAEEETREYLAQRLEGAGQSINVFSDEQVASIHEAADGWPGLINQVAHETLIENMLAQKGAAKRAGFAMKLPRKHLLALAVVGVGVLAAWFMQGQQVDSPPAPISAQLPLEGEPPTQAVVDQPAVAPGESPSIEFEGANQPLPLPLVGEAQPVIREPLAQAAGLSGAEEADVQGGVTIEAEEAAEIPVSPPVAPATELGAAVKPPVANGPAAPIAASPAAAVPVKSEPKPAVAAASSPAPKAAEPGRAAPASDWYAAQTASHYTLQILGARAQSSAEAFVKEQGGQYHYFKKQHQGKPLYVVTYGSFATRQAAQAALKNLPAKVQAGKPWPRTFASIRQEISSAP